MNSSDDFADGMAVGRDGRAPAPAPQRSSSAFGSPGADSTVRRLDLNDLLIRHNEATFMMRAEGNDMHGAGIDDGDLLVVDRALTAGHGSVVVAIVNGERRCRRLEQPAGSRRSPSSVRLVAEAPDVAPIAITEDVPLEIWGVVSFVIKALA
jgi:DNA polymerase V